MKRELKAYALIMAALIAGSDRKAHPDEKGTERQSGESSAATGPKIAKPIPMKRELKEVIQWLDEARSQGIAKPIPMKRELKDRWPMDDYSSCHGDRKAHPDEKGTERRGKRLCVDPVSAIAKPIPMKRELKALDSSKFS